MTKSDYIKIADILNSHIKECMESVLSFVDSTDLPLDGGLVEDRDTSLISETVSKFCEMFKQDNPDFDQDRFIQAVYKDK